jgi:hypothetical protein
MNKTAIKNFAVWARNKLITDITYKAGLIGVSEKGIAQPLPQSSKDLQFFDIGTKDYAQVAGADIEQRKALVRAIQDKESTSDYKTAFNAVVEEVAYTWFNRLIAIRFMEVNEYLPSRIRVLSSENPAKNEPDFVTTPFDTDMEFTMAEQDRIMQLKDENKMDELFRMLFIKQCNKLHEILPDLFEETNNYTELLLSISFTDHDGVVYHLVHDISEDDFNVEKEGQIEMIGWMYQFYNSELKAKVFSKRGKVEKEEIPAATQLFTPDWIVRYMVDNSLGRLWIEGHSGDNLQGYLGYYLDEVKQEANVQSQLEQIHIEYHNLEPESIKILDPCMGSGHILVYCFDVLMKIYESQGYTQRDAVQSILENNLYGMDIDKRAAQMAYFAVMMKGRQYDRRIFTRNIKPNVYEIEESNNINRKQLKYFGNTLDTTKKDKAILELTDMLDELEDAQEYGTIIHVNVRDWNLLELFVGDLKYDGQMTLDAIGIEQTQKQLFKLIKIAKLLAMKYQIVCTNPPYMSVSNCNAKLNKYIKDNYADNKSDLFGVFIERCLQFTCRNGFTSMVTQHSWMFLSSFSKLRTKILQKNIVSMAHLGTRAFEEIAGEVVQTTTFVIRQNRIPNYVGSYIKLTNFGSANEKKQNLIDRNNFFYTAQSVFNDLPNNVIAYWATDGVLAAFKNGKKLGEYAAPKQGLATTDNNRFVRLWFEVAFSDIGFGMSSEEANDSGLKWFPLNKGGSFRKWYGNNDCIVNYQYDGKEIKDNVLKKYSYLKTPDFVVKNQSMYFQENGTWSAISSGDLSVRYSPKGFVISNAGMAIFHKTELLYLIAFLNSKVVSKSLIKIINQTLNFNAGDIEQLPLIIDRSQIKRVEELTQKNIDISKEDWDSFESSWDFKKHPLI